MYVYLYTVHYKCPQELEAIKARVKEMEEEAEKLKDMQKEIEGSLNLSMSPTSTGTVVKIYNSTIYLFKEIIWNSTTNYVAALPSLEEKQEVDARSVYVGNVCFKQTTSIIIHKLFNHDI